MQKTYNEKDTLYSLRKEISISIPNVNSQKYGINSLNFRGSALWNNLPIKLKNCNFLQELSYCQNKVETYCALAQHVKHEKVWLPVVLFLNFNIYV